MSPRPSKSVLKRLLRARNEATNYLEWRSVQEEIDYRSGAMDRLHARWDDSSLIQLLENHLRQLDTRINRPNPLGLAEWVTQSLYRTMAELNDDLLYSLTPLCSHPAIGKYLERICHTLTLLADTEIPGLTLANKLSRLRAAERNLGVSGLLLSGGGTFGIYHLGVLKTLLRQDLLPAVISGTSMGSIAAGLAAVKTDGELLELFDNPRAQHHRPLRRLPLHQVLKRRSLLDDRDLQECVYSNLGQLTFAEAYARTGRTVSITVSPTRAGQKPRILNHLTSPNVLIAEASKASCSIPLLFPPVRLKARESSGRAHPYAAEERWADGTFATDIPRQRLARLCNVNFFVVSQANPHILPFATHRQQDGAIAALRDLGITLAHRNLTGLLDVAKRRVSSRPLRALLDHGGAFLEQDLFGDITIHPHFHPSWYLKFMANPSDEELDFLILTGERATWPLLARIEEQTRVGRTLQQCIKKLAGSSDSRRIAQPAAG